MDAQELLAEVEARGVALAAHGDRLRYSPPGSQVQPDGWPVTEAALLSMPLDDFARAGLVVRGTVLGTWWLGRFRQP